MAQLVKNPPAMSETWVRSLGWEDPLKKGTATHSSILAWRIPGLYSSWGHKESDMTESLSLLGNILGLSGCCYCVKESETQAKRLPGPGGSVSSGRARVSLFPPLLSS